MAFTVRIEENDRGFLVHTLRLRANELENRAAKQWKNASTSGHGGRTRSVEAAHANEVEAAALSHYADMIQNA